MYTGMFMQYGYSNNRDTSFSTTMRNHSKVNKVLILNRTSQTSLHSLPSLQRADINASLIDKYIVQYFF